MGDLIPIWWLVVNYRLRLYISGVDLKNLVTKSLESGIDRMSLAAQIGVSHGTIGNILSGRPPKKLNTLEKFAAYYKLSMEDLLSEQYGTVRTRPEATNHRSGFRK